MNAAHLYQDDDLLCDVRRIVGENDNEFVFQTSPLLPFVEDDVFYIMTDVAPSVGLKHYITFDDSSEKHHIDIKSVDGLSSDWISRCVYVRSN